MVTEHAKTYPPYSLLVIFLSNENAAFPINTFIKFARELANRWHLNYANLFDTSPELEKLGSSMFARICRVELDQMGIDLYELWLALELTHIETSLVVFKHAPYFAPVGLRVKASSKLQGDP